MSGYGRVWNLRDGRSCSMARKSTPDDFWRRVNKSEGCWIWSGAHFWAGYARVKYHGRDGVAHRVAWILTHGPVPDGLELDHLCRNRGCVNPSHLEPVTHRENEFRGMTIIRENMLKTHCKRGHPLSGDNLFIRRVGARHYYACHKMHGAKSRERPGYKEKHAAYERARRSRIKQETSNVQAR